MGKAFESVKGGTNADVYRCHADCRDVGISDADTLRSVEKGVKEWD